MKWLIFVDGSVRRLWCLENIEEEVASFGC